MTLDDVLQAISDTELSLQISMSAYAFPWLETIHVFALAIVFGSIAIVDLRLIGFTVYRKNASGLIKDMLPFTWVGFVFAVVTGALLFVSNPWSYAESFPFLLKMGLIILAGINMLVFHFGAYKSIAGWDLDDIPPTTVRLAGIISICTWTVILFLGRWIGFSAPFL